MRPFPCLVFLTAVCLNALPWIPGSKEAGSTATETLSWIGPGDQTLSSSFKHESTDLQNTATSFPRRHDAKSTDLVVRSPKEVAVRTEFSKEFYWYLAISSASLPGLGFALKGLVGSCETFKNDTQPSSGIDCVWGSIATASTLTGLGLGAIKVYLQTNAGRILMARLQPGLAGIDNRRHGGGAEDEHERKLLNQAKIHFAPDLELAGYVSRNDSFNGHIVPEGHEYWPVTKFSNPEGVQMHFTSWNYNGSTIHRLGYAPQKSKRGFNDQFFTHGGIEFKFKEEENEYRLRKSDYHNMKRAVKCYTRQLSTGGLNIQITAEDHHVGGTVAVLAISGVSSHLHGEIHELKLGPVQGSKPCDRNYISRG